MHQNRFRISPERIKLSCLSSVHFSKLKCPFFHVENVPIVLRHAQNIHSCKNEMEGY